MIEVLIVVVVVVVVVVGVAAWSVCFWLDGVYKRKYREEILRHKRERPDLAYWIDAETVSRGEGVIEREKGG